ncbi:MAG: hydantoinase/oxoprolinase family protein, partial [Alphaproteobacteria bacterium]|nr:hydantoinase/oxoprolinase family protein [Alphaproteobacteria bacterium]
EGETDSGPVCTRKVYLDAWVDVPVYAFDKLSAGTVVEGPAVIESGTTTVLLRAKDVAQTTAQRWLDIEVRD